jgi:hypothetical protein
MVRGERREPEPGQDAAANPLQRTFHVT